jgi:hypothetical protein
MVICPGEKGKRHCLPNASIMIHRELQLPITALYPVKNLAVSPTQNHPEALPDKLLILPFTQKKFFASASSSQESTNGIVANWGSRRNKGCTASVRAFGV